MEAGKFEQIISELFLPFGFWIFVFLFLKKKLIKLR